MSAFNKLNSSKANSANPSLSGEVKWHNKIVGGHTSLSGVQIDGNNSDPIDLGDYVEKRARVRAVEVGNAIIGGAPALMDTLNEVNIALNTGLAAGTDTPGLISRVAANTLAIQTNETDIANLDATKATITALNSGLSVRASATAVVAGELNTLEGQVTSLSNTKANLAGPNFSGDVNLGSGATTAGVVVLNGTDPIRINSSQAQITANNDFLDILVSGDTDNTIRIRADTTSFKSGVHISGNTNVQGILDARAKMVVGNTSGNVTGASQNLAEWHSRPTIGTNRIVELKAPATLTSFDSPFVFNSNASFAFASDGTVVFHIKPDGDVDIQGYVRAEQGSVVRQTMIEFPDGGSRTSSSFGTTVQQNYTKLANTRLHILCSFDYDYSGFGQETVESRLEVIGPSGTGGHVQRSQQQNKQKYTGNLAGGTRSGTLSGLGMRTGTTISNASGTCAIRLQIKENGDDTLDVRDGYFLVTEVVK